jgi:hypothetical protein
MPDGNCSAYGSQHRAARATSVLVARCENVHEPDGTPCTGRLSFRWGQSDAACDTCGARCGIAVADWLAVHPAAPAAEADEVDCGHHSWAGLMALLDEHWPADLFPTREDDPGRDAGARIVSLLRWVDRLQPTGEDVTCP